MKERFAIGIDLGGSSIKYALATNAGRIITTGQRPSDNRAGKNDIIDNLYQAVKELKDYADRADLKIEVIGMGTPGNVDLTTGMLMGSTPNFKNWKDINISKSLGERCGIPVYVDNDANLMALGEAQFGTGKGYKNMICVTVGTGIGGGIILNGELYRGAYYAGAELGHTLVEANGIRCNCGSRGCLEVYASATAIIRDYKKYAREYGNDVSDESTDVASIFKLYRQNIPSARKAIEDAAYYLGRGLASAINIFNPEAIIIGGGVANAGDIYIDAVRKTAFEYAMSTPGRFVKVLAAQLGNQAGFLGAVFFAFNQYRETGLSGSE